MPCAITATSWASGATTPSLRVETAAAHERVGDILIELGRFGDALAAYDQALALIEPLAGERPSDSRADAAQLRLHAGRLQALQEGGWYRAAIDAFDRARPSVRGCSTHVRDPRTSPRSSHGSTCTPRWPSELSARPTAPCRSLFGPMRSPRKPPVSTPATFRQLARYSGCRFRWANCCEEKDAATKRGAFRAEH